VGEQAGGERRPNAAVQRTPAAEGSGGKDQATGKIQGECKAKAKAAEANAQRPFCAAAEILAAVAARL
jgi:hypothetical protein